MVPSFIATLVNPDRCICVSRILDTTECFLRSRSNSIAKRPKKYKKEKVNV